jgi:hypothetical protein
MKTCRNRQLIALVRHDRSKRPNNGTGEIRAVIAKHGMTFPAMENLSRKKSV